MERTRKILGHFAQTHGSSNSLAPLPSSADNDTLADNDVCIVAAARTPMASFRGGLESFSAVQLGSKAISGALQRSGLSANDVGEVYMGNVLSANLGQAPARQAAILAGLPHSVPCTTVNKVCSSGLKAVMLGAQAIALGQQNVVVCGGMESMSNTPYYVPSARNGARYGNKELVDGLTKDGLSDAYNHRAMGECGELCADEFKFTREDQDVYAEQSYRRAQANAVSLAKEIVPVEIKSRKGIKVVAADEEVGRLKDFSKLRKLRPVFVSREKAKSGLGSVTAGNSSPISDGAAAVVLASGARAKQDGLTVLAKIRCFADAAHAPEWFTTAPASAIQKVCTISGVALKDIDYFELNEAFSVVALANLKLLKLSDDKVNVFGGAVSMGHPLGTSGCRILVTLLNVLATKNAKLGMAGICNGGGGASAMLIERV